MLMSKWLPNGSNMIEDIVQMSPIWLCLGSQMAPAWSQSATLGEHGDRWAHDIQYELHTYVDHACACPDIQRPAVAPLLPYPRLLFHLSCHTLAA